jgi:nitroreductase/NAD-dependent dihydropyrimidine dehydrogenase PreA subunit
MKNLIDNSLITVDLDRCTLCNACVNDCVARLFYIDSNTLNVCDEFEEACISCGHCVAVCPVDAIKLKGYDSHETKSLEDTYKTENSPDFDSFYKLVLKRRSIRQFKEKAIPKELIDKLLDLARFSPTGSNSENIYYTIITDKEIVAKISNIITIKVKRFAETLEDLKGREIAKARMSNEEFKLAIENLPKTKRILKTIESGVDFWCWEGELILIHGDLAIGGISTNSALAAAHLMLAAETLGLGTCSLGYLTFHANQSDTIKQLINLPKNHEVGYSLTMGYPKVKYKRVPPRKALRAQWL